MARTGAKCNRQVRNICSPARHSDIPENPRLKVDEECPEGPAGGSRGCARLKHFAEELRRTGRARVGPRRVMRSAQSRRYCFLPLLRGPASLAWTIEVEFEARYRHIEALRRSLCFPSSFA